jgi:ribosomal protein S18 acetylase RimI-like enzyme
VKDAAGDIDIVEVTAADAAAFKALRLRGLREHPEAFGESAEDFEALSLDQVVERITSRRSGGGFILGARARSSGDLVGVVGIAPDRGRKSAHRATLWGVYVAGEHRGRGICRRLIDAALARCRRDGQIEQVRLGVATTNAPAIAVYCAAGFVEYGREPRVLRVDGRDYDEYLMVVELNSSI